MELKIVIDDLTLNSVVGDVLSYDEEGDIETVGTATVADKVARLIADDVIKRPEYTSLKERVTEIRNEEIRIRLAPLIEAALQNPLNKTNTYGERTGRTTTLSEIIMEEAKKAWTPDNNAYGNRKVSVRDMIATEVNKQISGEVAKAVKLAQDEALKAVGELAGAPLVDALRKALKGV